VVHVLIILGGTEMQCPHADHPRVYCNIIGGGQGKVAYELDRENFNAAVASKYGQSSIIIDLSDKGMNLALISCYSKKHDKQSKTVAVKFGDSKVFNVVQHDSYQKTSTKIDMTVLKILGGVQFAGDMMHTGANNVSKKSLANFKAACNAKKGGLLKALDNCPSAMECAWFFCMTRPKQYDLTNPTDSVYLLTGNECEYDEKPLGTTAFTKSKELTSPEKKSEPKTTKKASSGPDLPTRPSKQK
jgi:hypothetical protein